MADISQAVNQILANDARLDDAMDLWPLAVPGVVGDDKARGMITIELAKRLRQIMINRSGDSVTASVNLTGAFSSSAVALTAQITPKYRGMVMIRMAVWVSLSTNFSWRYLLQRDDDVLLQDEGFYRSYENPGDTGQGEPVIIYLLDEGAVVGQQHTYTVRFRYFGGGNPPSFRSLQKGTNFIIEEL